jgi:hypothetical protein
MRPSCEAASCAATQEFPSILWNPMVQYRFHKSPPLVPILSKMDPVHTTPSCLSKIHFNIVPHLHLGLPSGLFPSGFSTNILYVFLFVTICATCPVHLIYDLITVIVFGEEYKLWSCSVYSFLQSAFWNTLSKLHIHTRTEVYVYLYLTVLLILHNAL